MIFKVIWLMRAVVYKFFFQEVGWMTYMGQPIFLCGVKNISLGRRVRILPHARMETYKKGKIKIEDNCSIGQRLTITAAESVVIGRDTLISFDVMITDLDHEFKDLNVPIFDQPLIVKETKIGPNCFIGAGVKIQAGTTLGRHCVVGANSVVRGEFPDYSVIVGAPARIVKRYNFETSQWESVKK